MNLKINFMKFLVKTFYYIRFKFEVNYNDFDYKRKDPYFLVGNHPCLHDGLYTSVQLHKYVYPVINAFMYVNKGMRFVLTKLIKTIPKRKGQSDIITIREMMKIIKRGNGILLFPEGNASFFGEESEIPFSTVKLFKKMKLDIVTVITNGAYLTVPRWSEKATRRGLFELNFRTLYRADELEKMSLEEIYEGLSKALKFNDFAWNRERKYLYKPKKRALGLEQYIYVCPKCLDHQTIYTKNNTVLCKHCGEIAKFNEYSLLEGLEFDNLIDWSKIQLEQVPKISKEVLHSAGSLFKVDFTKFKTLDMGFVIVELDDVSLSVKGKYGLLEFELNKIDNLILTKKNDLSFDYNEETYYIKIKDPMLFYDVIKFKQGGLK